MKALVTGATGFIGSALVRELLKDGVEVRVLVREKSNTRNIDGLDVEKAYGDIRDKEAVKAALQGCSTFYQAAAIYEMWGVATSAYYDVNVEGTKVALSAALEQRVEKVVYTSSVIALGCHGCNEPAREDAEFNLQKNGPYAESKYLGEVEALKLCQEGLPLVIVNPGVVIGERDIRPTPSGREIVDHLNKRFIGLFEGGLNYVDVEDVARGHILAAQKGRVGERYILGNANMTLIDYHNLVAQVSGVEAPKLKLPYAVTLAGAYFFQLIAGISKKPPPITPSHVKAIGAYSYFDSSKAVSELGFKQRPIRTTVEKAVNWFRENGYVKAA